MALAKANASEGILGAARGISLTLPIRTVSEANRREHWAAKAKRVANHRGVVGLALRVHLHRLDSAGELVVTLTRLAPRRLDSDNAVGSFKALRDGIADTLGVDDGDARITWNYGQEKSKTYGVRIEIRRRECAS